MLQGGLNYSDLLLLVPGDYKLKIIIRNNKTGEMGSRDLPVKVQNFGTPELHLATPCFLALKSDWMNIRGYDPAKPPARLKDVRVEYPLTFKQKTCVASIYPDLAARGEHLLLVKLYNLQLDPKTKDPNTNIACEVVGADGVSRGIPTFKLAEGTRIDEKNFEFLFNVEAPSLEPGLYWMKIKAADRLTGKMATDSIPFFVQ